jgi:hypothetical protein
VSTVLGPEVHGLVSQVELPKPAAAALRRAKKIAPVKFSRTGDMGRIAMIHSAILADDDDKQREIGYRIDQIVTDVGFTVSEPVSAMIRHATYVAASRGVLDVRASLEAHLWTPYDDELSSRLNNVGDDNRGRTFTEMFRRFDPMGAPQDYYTHGKRGYPVAWQFELETSYLDAAADFGLPVGNDEWSVNLVDHAYDEHAERIRRTLAGKPLIPRDFGRPFSHEAVERPPFVASQPRPHSGYYLDPLEPDGHKRWWDGKQWTDRLHPGHDTWRVGSYDDCPPELCGLYARAEYRTATIRQGYPQELGALKSAIKVPTSSACTLIAIRYCVRVNPVLCSREWVLCSRIGPRTTP